MARLFRLFLREIILNISQTETFLPISKVLLGPRLTTSIFSPLNLPKSCILAARKKLICIVCNENISEKNCRAWDRGKTPVREVKELSKNTFFFTDFFQVLQYALETFLTQKQTVNLCNGGRGRQKEWRCITIKIFIRAQSISHLQDLFLYLAFTRSKWGFPMINALARSVSIAFYSRIYQCYTSAIYCIFM